MTPYGNQMKLSQPSKALHPPLVYKYYGRSKAYSDLAFEQLIVHSKVFFPGVKSFNDPFDCQLIPDFTGDYSDKFNFVRGMVLSTPSVCSDIEDRISRNLKFCADPGGDNRMLDVIRDTADQYGILSLSEDPLSMEMWSYYADGHEGLCFCFDWTKRNLQSFQLLKMEYSANYPVIKFYQMDFNDAVAALVKTKAESWAHEKEWRIVAPNMAGQYLQIPEGALTGIILGLKCPDTLERLVRDWNDGRVQPANILRIKRKPMSFELELAPA